MGCCGRGGGGGASKGYAVELARRVSGKSPQAISVLLRGTAFQLKAGGNAQAGDAGDGAQSVAAGGEIGLKGRAVSPRFVLRVARTLSSSEERGSRSEAIDGARS